MRLPIIKIGNSRGLRLPKPIIEQCGFGKEVEIEVRNDELVIKPVKPSRQDWEQAFKTMAEKNDDVLIDLPNSSWDQEEWEWN